MVDAAKGAWAGVTRTTMHVDPDAAEKLITDLSLAKDKLMDLYEKSWQLRNAESPGKDMYSGLATLAIRKSAGDDPGGYGWANLKGREALQTTMDNIQAALDKYRELDGDGQQAFRTGGAGS